MARRISEVLGAIVRKVSRKKPPPVPARPNRPATSPASRDSVLDGVDIEYNPSLDGNADPGEVVWTLSLIHI